MLKNHLSNKDKDSLFGLSLMLPAILILGLVVFFPIIRGICMSFQDYTIRTMNNPTWNDFENYKNLFSSGDIWTYLKNTGVFVIAVVGIEFLLAIPLALLLNTDIKGRNIFRGLFLIPWVMPSVVVAILFSWILQPQYGVFNYILYSLGIIDNINMQWLQNSTLAMPTVVTAAVWRQMPFVFVMILAGLQSVSKDYLEAASIDGATKWQQLIHITLPSIRPVIMSTLLISVMNNFQMFTLIYNLTVGGPVDVTTMLSIAAYQKAFTEFNFGQGSAIGVIWLVILMLIYFVINRMNKKYNDDYA